MTEYVNLYEFYEILLGITFWKDKPDVCTGIKMPSSRTARKTFGFWAAFGLVQLMKIGSYM